MTRIRLVFDVTTGVVRTHSVLEEPIRRIVINAGSCGVEGAVIVMEVKKNKKAAYGFNAATEEYMDMIEAGIIEAGAPRRLQRQQCSPECSRESPAWPGLEFWRDLNKTSSSAEGDHDDQGETRPAVHPDQAGVGLQTNRALLHGRELPGGQSTS